MNHCYRLVFNTASQVWQAVAETAKSHRKSKSSKGMSFSLALVALTFAANAQAELAANALPTGAQVVSGQVSFSQTANQLNIHQATQKAITNWTSFNIGALSEVNFIQNNASSISLNRVLSADPSQIFGKLNANGQVWLINPNGILFGKSAQVNVGGLLASTLNIADEDFLNSNYKFTGNTGSVVNMGSIVSNNGGYVAMFSPQIRNEGVISALEGASILAAGDAITMDFNGNGLINVQVDSANVNALIENKHLIKVGGGQVLMSSKAADGLITSVINNSGRIEADSMLSDGGVVRLTSAKTVINSGEISAKSSATNGGTVHMLGENVGVFDAGSINVNGKTGGGTILLGGDYQGKNANIQNAQKTFISQNAQLSADANETGNGGKVIVWADDTTRYYGSISAKGGAVVGNGGFVEVSGKNYLDFNGSVNTSASNGDAGTLLLDPTNITISTGVNSIESSGATTFQETTPTATSILNTTTLQTALASNNVNVTTASAAASAGTITVANAVTWASANSLTLTANSTIAINAAVTTGTAASALILNATGNVTQSAAGIIGGAGGLIKNGAGTATLSQTNTYTGATNINAGSLTLGAANRIADASAVTVASGATFNLNNFAETVGSIAGAGNVTLGSAILTSGGNNTSTSFTGVASGTGGLTKAGTGALTLSGANTYTGDTNINAGTLTLGAANRIANASAVTVASGATFNLNNFAETVGSIAGAGNVTLGSAILTSGGNNTSTSFTGVASGTGGLTKAGTGALTLSGANTYTGATTISAGTLALDATGTIAASSGVANAGTLSIAAAKTIDSMTGAGATTLGANTLTIGDASNTSSAYSGIVSGTGGLTKAGTGTLTLGGANTYTGATNINAGTLTLGAANRIADASAVTVASGATFNLNSFAETIGSIAGAGNVTLGSATLTSGGDNTSTSFTGIASGTGGLTKAGTGILTLGGANTYTGATTISAGTLQIGNGGTTGAVSGNITNNANLILNRSNALTYGGVISGTGSVQKNGAGTLTLTNANTYTGATNINAGTLIASNFNALGAAGGGTTVANGATLNVNNVTLAESALIINGTGDGGVVGALTGTGAANVSGTVTTASDSNIGTTSAASTLNLTGVVTAANNLGIIGAGNVTAVNAANNFSTVNINGANNVSLRDVNGIILGNGASNVTGNLGLQTAGAITQTASVTVSGATTLNAGAANNITLNNAANNFNGVTVSSGQDVSLVDANALILNASTAKTMTAQTLSGNLTLAGNITATGAGNAIVLASAANFINGGNFSLNPGTGRWLLYSTDPALDTRGAGLLAAYDFKQYNTPFGGAIAGTGDGFIYSLAPTITATVSGSATKTYDGTTTAPIGSLALSQTGAIDGDTVTLSAITSATYDNKNVGTGKTVTVSGVAIASQVNGVKPVYGYDMASTTATGAVGTINQRAITVTAATDTKTYDATTSSVGAPTITTGSIVSGDSAVFSQTFNNKNAGTGKTLTATGTVTDGNGGNNYAVSYVTNNTGVINQLGITGAITANNKVYDATTAATIASRSLAGVIVGDTVNYTGGVATFDNKNVGTGKTVTATGLGLTGGDAGNYTVNTTATTTSDITQLAITGSITANNKTYDGNNTATIASRSLAGVISGDIVNYIGGSATFDNKNAGTGKTVTATGLSLSGGDAANYTVNTTAATAADIAKAALALNAATDSKTYDGNTTSTALVTSIGLVGGDTATAIQSFDSKNVLGANNSILNVNAGFTVNDGNSGGNYTVTTNAATGTITKATLVLNAATDSKTYDGNTTSTALVTSIGLVGGDTATATQSFASKNVLGVNGSTLNVNAGFVVNDGNSGGNYNITTNSATGTINAKALTVTASNQVKTYGQTVNFAGTEFTSAGLVVGETIGSTTLNSAGAINTANVAGSPYAITASNAAGGTFDANNYVINYVNGTLTVNRASLTVAANNASKSQGAANPAFSSTITGFVNGETSAVLLGALGHSTPAVTSSPIGSYAITPFGVTADNYTISFIGGVLTVGLPARISLLNGALTRPEQAQQTCGSAAANDNAMISGLDTFGLDDVEYKESVAQPLVGGVVANALVSSGCLKL